jgi:uncharacterized protein involved in outer membrane biogenesis
MLHFLPNPKIEKERVTLGGKGGREVKLGTVQRIDSKLLNRREIYL